MKTVDDEKLLGLDLTQFNAGESPYADNSLETGWSGGAEFFRDTIVNRVGFTNGRVLDLLCGYGRWSVFLAEVNDSLVGVDRLEGCISIARGLCEELGLNNTRFFCEEDDFTATFPDESFDFVWLYGALQYIDRAQTLSEVYRLLTPGGRVFISNYNSVGMMLTHLEAGIANNEINIGNSQWALNALQKGELSHGVPSYATLESAETIAQDFGFELVCAAADRRMDVRDDRKIQIHDDIQLLHGHYLSTIELLFEKPTVEASSRIVKQVDKGLGTRVKRAIRNWLVKLIS